MQSPKLFDLFQRRIIFDNQEVTIPRIFFWENHIYMR